MENKETLRSPNLAHRIFYSSTSSSALCPAINLSGYAVYFGAQFIFFPQRLQHFAHFHGLRSGAMLRSKKKTHKECGKWADTPPFSQNGVPKAWRFERFIRFAYQAVSLHSTFQLFPPSCLPSYSIRDAQCTEKKNI